MQAFLDYLGGGVWGLFDESLDLVETDPDPICLRLRGLEMGYRVETSDAFGYVGV